MWAESQAEMMRGIVRFEAMADERFPESMPPDGRALIASLMQADAPARATMEGVRSHAFFEGLDMASLYSQTPPPLSQGIAPPAPNASWTRRQNSMMWSPLPQRYDFGGDAGGALDVIAETTFEADAPFAPGGRRGGPVFALGALAE
eukprot:6859595-Prymnesium_polylepis.1